jgi:hypothetical protein
MNLDSLRSHGHSGVPLQPEWQLQIEAWRDLLAQCARKPSRRRVHALRSLTLRLRVALEYRLEQAPDATAARAFKRWNKEGRMLRRALEPVRDADVYLARLDGLRDSLGGAPDSRPKLSPHCLREMDKLEGRLEQRRQTGIDELMAVIDARGKRLRRLSKEMEVALAHRMSSRVLSTRQEALRIFGELAREFPHISQAPETGALPGGNLCHGRSPGRKVGRRIEEDSCRLRRVARLAGGRPGGWADPSRP